MILIVKSDYFLTSINWLAFVTEVLCFLWGTNKSYNYYIDECQALKG